jgi:preprotein translocase subunit SecF
MEFENFYNKNYKKLLIAPAILLLVSLIYVTMFYSQTGDFFHKDVTLTGGTSIELFTDLNIKEFEQKINTELKDFSLDSVSDNSGKQLKLILTSPKSPEEIKPILEKILGYELTEENSTVNFTNPELGENFYKQLLVSVLLAFFWMAGVVFVIFSDKLKIKLLVILLNLIFGIFLGSFYLKSTSSLIFLPLLILMIILISIYIKYSIPSFAVMLSAFADIIMTLTVIDVLGMKLSKAGIVAFLLLIGYSVDTDVLLTTRVLRRKHSINNALTGAFATSMTMTLTSIIAVLTALIAIYSFESVLNQIFIILIIGLCFDIFNTWITNASIIKWYAESKK